MTKIILELEESDLRQVEAIAELEAIREERARLDEP